MNTLEINNKNLIKSFDELYKIAKKQFYNYEKLEGIEDWKKYDFSIDCSEDQLKFKDMLETRFIEELTEASAALNEPEHFWEEITDALNFFLSAYIMIDTDFSKLNSPELYLNKFSNKRIPSSLVDVSQLFYPVIHYVGYLCNLLKNRAWTQSNYLVSMIDFNERLNILWGRFWLLLRYLGLSKEDVFDLFEKKVLVNKWRIETGY